MRHLLRTFSAALALLITAPAAMAQAPVPNGSFENWEFRNPEREVPQNWITIEDILEQEFEEQIPSFGLVNKSTTARQGTFAVELTNVNLGDAVEPIIVPGILSNGTVATYGVPYTSRPSRLEFWYKLTGPQAAADSAGIQAILTRYSEGTTKLIGGIILFLPPTETYTLVSEPLDYTPEGLSPDTLLMDAISGDADEIHAGTSLLLDDIRLTGSITATRNPEAEAALQIYPNPSTTGEFSLASLTNAAVSTAPFTVTDVTGRVVLRQDKAPLSAARGRLIDLRQQRGGVYMLQLNTPDGILTRKLIIQ
ncbi:T9SS C-terminal target domain-containing protein [Hymenobacter sediminis]|uniref:T9SS type A sorting domain-containing protein n=1 Tax=Hymenobacter sediminis TaxID=2218621 RepID=UPI000DA6D877|nr:T9SS type A sorting domain-containing protein [Hymenobacter sediminis]RPD50412.1 T9SS C-terminal target domain-containing protein [Hymenobacter sediminis]